MPETADRISPYGMQAPIGVFDSGLGGLSVAREIARHLPHEPILYFADTRHVPYGSRTDAEICELTSQAVDWLAGQGCKLVVVACNTASAFSLAPLRARYGSGLPIVGLVPAVKPAAISSQRRVIGVLATPGTLRGHLLQDVIDQEAAPRGVQVITLGSSELVRWVEQGEQAGADCRAHLEALLQPLRVAGADRLVLGCTHFPFLQPVITDILGPQVELVDSGMAVARQVGRLLAARRATGQVMSQCPDSLPAGMPPVLDRPALTMVFSGEVSRSAAVVPHLIGPDWFGSVRFNGLSA